LKQPARPCPIPCHDAVFGQPIAAGYPVSDVVTGATAEFLDQFHGQPDGWVAEATARCYRSKSPGDKSPLGRIALATLALDDGSLWHPVISLASATAERPAWRDLVRAIWPTHAGQQGVIILTTDPQKRLWPRTRLGALGDHAPILVHDSGMGISAMLWINWPRLLSVLALVEQAYQNGFPKTAINFNLWSAYQPARAHGWSATSRLEGQLAAWRSCPEFTVAILIAQKGISP
jgi:hypothetical protein